MPQICWYFELHQPYRLANFSIFDLGHDQSYFVESGSEDRNREIFLKVADKSYRPMLKLLKKLLKKYTHFCFALSCSGVFLEQVQQYAPDVLNVLQGLVKTGQVELLTETYYHSLSNLYSESEFKKQVILHEQVMKKLFGVKPTVFRNTELIYSNQIAEQVVRLGYTGMLTEAVWRYMDLNDRTKIHTDRLQKLLLLLKHAELSDDIAFRFSNKGWSGYPLTVDKYYRWLQDYPRDHLINLFMDFETFGEHQWADTGIFKFFEELVVRIMADTGSIFVTPSQAFEAFRKSGKTAPLYDVPDIISWADVDRDLTAWIENPFQQDSLQKIYALEKQLVRLEKRVTPSNVQPVIEKLLQDWRKLQTSDHFYYMCTKWSADGDVHAYFSPYESPYEAYRRFSIVLADLEGRLHQLNQST